MKRRPLYAHGFFYRIISFPSDLWACQQCPKGARSHKSLDPWENTHRPTSREEALRQLSTLADPIPEIK